MKIEALEFLACPVCKGPLLLSDENWDEEGGIVSGVLRCEKCLVSYPIEDGIPNLLSLEARTAGRIRWTAP